MTDQPTPRAPEPEKNCDWRFGRCGRCPACIEEVRQRRAAPEPCGCPDDFILDCEVCAPAPEPTAPDYPVREWARSVDHSAECGTPDSRESIAAWAAPDDLQRDIAEVVERETLCYPEAARDVAVAVLAALRAPRPPIVGDDWCNTCAAMTGHATADHPHADLAAQVKATVTLHWFHGSECLGCGFRTPMDRNVAAAHITAAVMDVLRQNGLGRGRCAYPDGDLDCDPSLCPPECFEASR